MENVIDAGITKHSATVEDFLFGSSDDESTGCDIVEGSIEIIPHAIYIETKRYVSAKSFEREVEMEVCSKDYQYGSIYDNFLKVQSAFEQSKFDERLRVGTQVMSDIRSVLQETNKWPNKSVKQMYIRTMLLLALSHLSFQQFKQSIQCIDNFFTMHGANKITAMYYSLVVSKVVNPVSRPVSKSDISFLSIKLNDSMIAVPNVMKRNKQIQSIDRIGQTPCA